MDDYDHEMWKLIHLLYEAGPLTMAQLRSAGVPCYPDSIQFLVDDGVVTQVRDAYELSKPVRGLLRTFTIALGPTKNVKVRVDYPEAFVIMPFSEPWSDKVYTELFKPGIEEATINEKKDRYIAIRGDSIVRVGDLSTNVWQCIAQAGLIVADVSAWNPNVFYEIGLADALGKPKFLFKEENAQLPADFLLPADFRGVHYYTYNLNELPSACKKLKDDLSQWAKERDIQASGVKAILG